MSEIDSAQKDAQEAIAVTLALLETTPAVSETFTKTAAKFSANDNVFKDKSLASIKPEHAILWVELLQKILTNRADKVYSTHFGTIVFQTILPPILMQSFTLLLFWPQWEVRKKALTALGEIIKTEEYPFAQAVADSIYNETVSGNLQQVSFLTSLLKKLSSACKQDQSTRDRW